jgi:hypothetical protein
MIDLLLERSFFRRRIQSPQRIQVVDHRRIIPLE